MKIVKILKIRTREEIIEINGYVF